MINVELIDLLIEDYFSVASAGLVTGFALATIVSFLSYFMSYISGLFRKI